MNIREKQEQREHLILSPYAAFSDQSKGRDVYEEPCDMRPVYQRDRDRILHSKSFRRLKGKTQVFLEPEGDHYRTRLTHPLEVSQIARTIAKALRLNEELTEAIALGHDLGHTPFGHAGERALNEIYPEGFRHYEQSVRVVELIERDGAGLNLTWEVRDGILNHQVNTIPATLEGRVVRLSDKIAYISHDVDDAIRADIISEESLPKSVVETLGKNVSDRLDTLIHDIIDNSEGINDIVQSEEVAGAMKELREFMFAYVYTNPIAKGQEGKAESMIKQLYSYYCDHVDLLPKEYITLYMSGKATVERAVCDYVAGMTDSYAITKFREVTIPTSWSVY